MTDSITYTADGHARSFVGLSAVNIYAAASLVGAIKLYLKSGIRMSRMHTPGNMLAKATEITGQAFKGRPHAKLEAAETALRLWLTEAKLKVLHINEGEEA